MEAVLAWWFHPPATNRWRSGRFSNRHGSTELEAPQKELDLRAKQAADAEAKDEKSRLVNKPEFRP